MYECNHVYVEYQLGQARQRAGLFVNVRGCGYPPGVDCHRWIGQFGVNDSTIQCFYSRTNTSFAVTQHDHQGAERDLLLAVLVPLVLCLVSGSSLCAIHTKCVLALKSQKER